MPHCPVSGDGLAGGRDELRTHRLARAFGTWSGQGRGSARQVVAKLRDNRLTKAAELGESGIEETTSSPTSIGGAFAPTTLWGASCARSDGVRRVVGAILDDRSALNLAARLRASGTSPARNGRRRAIDRWSS